MTDIKEMVDDYIERNQESVEEFENPDEIYAEIVDQLDSLEVPFLFPLSPTFLSFTAQERCSCLMQRTAICSGLLENIHQDSCNCRRKYQWQWQWPT